MEVKRAADLHALPWHRVRSFLHHELGKWQPVLRIRDPGSGAFLTPGKVL